MPGYFGPPHFSISHKTKLKIFMSQCFSNNFNFGGSLVQTYSTSSPNLHVLGFMLVVCPKSPKVTKISLLLRKMELYSLYYTQVFQSQSLKVKEKLEIELPELHGQVDYNDNLAQIKNPPGGH